MDPGVFQAEKKTGKDVDCHFVIDKTTATKILHPLCGLRGYRKGLETMGHLLTIATGALTEAHLQAAVRGWLDDRTEFPAPADFRTLLNGLTDAHKLGQHGCPICQNSARMVTDLFLVTFVGNTFMKDPRQPPEIVQRNWKSEWDDTPDTKALRAKLGANQRLVAGARKCECVKGTT